MVRERDRRRQHTNGDARFNHVALHVAQREGQRQIKLHEDVEKATSKQEAEAITNAGLPDMRFAQDKLKFQRDPRRRMKDGQPDRRFLENRPDLLEARRRKMGPVDDNFIFTQDMLPDNAEEIMDEVEAATE